MNGKDWIQNTNVYEVNLRQYTEEGTFEAFGRHLPRLKDMGVDTLWFMPVTPISQKEKKGTMGSYYACSDYTAINPEFGTLEDFQILVRSAQEMGFKVIIDWVANHTGCDHVWTVAHPDWYKKDEEGNFKKASGMDDIIELDHGNAYLRNAMIEAMKFWIIDCGVDGFRCDLAFWVPLQFWLEAIPQLNELKPLFWLAEADALDHPEYMQVFDAAYTWRWMHRSEDFCKQKFSLQGLKQIIVDYAAAPGIPAWFTSNHDENSWNGSEYEKYNGLAKSLALLSCTMKGIPLMYSGQEVPNLKRLQFFDKDIIEWKEENALHDFYQTLLHLQRQLPSLRADAPMRLLQTDASDQIIAYSRGNDDVLVLINFSPEPVHVNIQENLDGEYRLLFWNALTDFAQYKNFKLKPYDFLVYTRP